MDRHKFDTIRRCQCPKAGSTSLRSEQVARWVCQRKARGLVMGKDLQDLDGYATEGEVIDLDRLLQEEGMVGFQCLLRSGGFGRMASYTEQ